MVLSGGRIIPPAARLVHKCGARLCHTAAAEPAARSGGGSLDYLPALHGDYFKFESRSVGRPFHIYVASPEGYEENQTARCPVVYMLDGDSLFPILAASPLFIHYDEGGAPAFPRS